MSATIKIVQLKHQIKKDKTIPILIRVTIDRKSTYKKTGYSVKENQFREGVDNWVVGHPDAILLNAAIEKLRHQLSTTILTAQISDVKVDMNTISSKPVKGSKTMYNCVLSLMRSYEKRNQVASYNRMNTNLNYLKDAWNGQDYLLKDITKDLVIQFADYRFSLGNSVNTVKKNLQDLSTVLTFSDHEGVDHFKKYSKQLKQVPVQRHKLEPKEIKALEAAELTGYDDLARDMYLFSFYCHGMRFENVALFDKQWIKPTHLEYRMNKGQKIRNVEIHPKLDKLIQKYINAGSLYLFPIIKETPDPWTKKDIVGRANALIRKHLHVVALRTGINENIHFHTARHTFANISNTKGVSKSTIKDALGHTNYGTTEKYLKSLSDDHINNEVRTTWE